jgi:O-antigen ligase
MLAPALILAATIPALLAYNLPPSATLLNQAAALLGWGGVVAFVALHARGDLDRADAGLTSLLAAFAVLIAAALASPLWTAETSGLALSNAGIALAACALILGGAAATSAGRANELFRAFCWAWLVAGVLSLAVGLVQVFAPGLADGDWIARSSFAGRAVGNLRQPNHLSSLLLWSAIAVVWLVEAQALGRRLGQLLYALMVFGIVLSASRTGAVGVVLLALWGLLDRRLARPTRVLLMLSPVFYAVAWVGLAAWAQVGHHVFGAEERLAAEGDISSSRFAIWANTLSLIAAHPWLGVGFGNFNFAWTLSVFPQRPIAFFDHTHNLPLQFAVELGLPLAALVLALLAHALWRAFAASRSAAGLEATTLRAAFMTVLMMALHSQLEYPLWYAYFLLPTALAFGLCLGGGASRRSDAAPASSVERVRDADEADAPAVRSPALLAAGLLVAAGGMFMLVDYARVVAIFAPGAEAVPLAERIGRGQGSVFFAHHADYAAATTVAHPADALAPAKRAAHYLLDARLMIAWAKAYAAAGDLDRARYLAARLREFRNENAAAFFAECDAPPAEGAAPPFQCAPPSRPMDYRDFE